MSGHFQDSYFRYAPMRFIWNVIRVTTFFFIKGRFREFFFMVIDGLPMIWASVTVIEEEKAPASTFHDRLYQCGSCPVFDQKMRTCGNPWDESKTWDDPVTRGRVAMGCFCQMEYKAQLKGATCWLNEQTDYAFGWKRRDSEGADSNSA